MDNDGDGNRDCADAGCDGSTGPNGETCESVEVSCNDNADNDGDGLADCEDPACAAAPNCSGTGSGSGGGGCSVANTSTTTSTTILNFLLTMLAVGLVFGIRRQKR